MKKHRGWLHRARGRRPRRKDCSSNFLSARRRKEQVSITIDRRQAGESQAGRFTGDGSKGPNTAPKLNRRNGGRACRAVDGAKCDRLSLG